MKILVTFPFFADPEIAIRAYESFSNIPDVDIFTIDDNAKPEVKRMIESNHIPINVVNEKDQFATGCWNQAMKYFLEHPEYDILRIGFSDVVMQNGWKEILEANFDEDEAILPTFTKTPDELATVSQEPAVGVKEVTTKGTPADCVFLSRKMVELVYPVPEEIKLWYNDEYIFTIMRNTGHRVVLLENLFAHHYGSMIINGVYSQESHDQIEIDKKNWSEKIEKQMWEKIDGINRQQAN